MESVAAAVSDWVEVLIAERIIEIGVALVVMIAWRWIMGHRFRQEVADLKKAHLAEIADLKRRIDSLEQEPSEEGLVGPPIVPIPPEKAITEHGILTMGSTGYPERLTSWERMREGEMAPPPAAPPENDDDDHP